MSAPPRPRYALGLGCDRGTPCATLQRAVQEALALVDARPQDVAVAVSIDIKADEAGLHELARQHGWPLRFFPAAQLAQVPVPNPSETVRRHTGTPSVSEAAALLAAGDAAQPAPLLALRVEKHKCRGADGRHATVSVACMAPPLPSTHNPLNERQAPG